MGATQRWGFWVLLVVLVGATGCGARSTRWGQSDSGPDADVDSDVDVDVDTDVDTDDPCRIPDADRDGHDSIECGGDDCDDEDPHVHPGTPDDGRWSAETIDSNAGDPYPSVAVDGFGVVHASYYHRGREIRYGRRDRGSWSLETVNVDEVGSRWSAVAVDREGTAYVVYSGIVLARRGGDGWEREVIENGSAQDLDAVFDRDDHLNVVYGMFFRGTLHWAHQERGAWTIETVVESPNVGQDAALSSSPDGTPRVAWHDLGIGAPMLSTRGEAGWTTETLDAGGDRGAYVDVWVGTDGTTHLAYYDRGATALRYATDARGDWSIETVDADGDVGAYASVAGDAAGTVHIAYEAQGVGELRHAARSAEGWDIEVVEAGWSGVHVDLAAGPYELHAVYVDGSDDVRHAWRALPNGVDDDCDGVPDE